MNNMDKIRIKIISNPYPQSIDIEKIVRSELKCFDLDIVDEFPYDIVVCIGGDGTMLYALDYLNFDSNPIYVGINSGGLGFLQHFRVTEISELIHFIRNFKSAIYSFKMILEIEILDWNLKVLKKYALNELMVLGKNDTRIIFELYSRGVKINTGNINADKIIFSTPTGSTGHLKSYGGPILCSEFPVIVQQLIAPINNVKVGRFISNPIISDEFSLVFSEKQNNMMLNIDGKPFESCAKSIRIKIGNKSIKFAKKCKKEERMLDLFLN